jgi:hypothetical protein
VDEGLGIPCLCEAWRRISGSLSGSSVAADVTLELSRMSMSFRDRERRVPALHPVVGVIRHT